MRNKTIEKANRANAAGVPFPLANEQMQKLRYWYQSKLSNQQLMVLLLVWVKNDFDFVSKNKKFPQCYRLKSGQDAGLNCLRIIRNGGVSWVEYSIKLDNDKFIWIPVPRALKSFFWRVLQEFSYEKPILSAKEERGLYRFWMSKMSRPRAERGIKIANKTAWANYIKNYCQADTLLPSNAKALYFSKLHHSSADAYQTNIIDFIRSQLFESINNSINRLILEAEKWGILPSFERSIKEHHIIPNRYEPLAQYLIETSGVISEIQVIYKQHHREVNKARGLYVGTKNSVVKSDVIHFFNELNYSLSISKRQARNNSGFIYYYNQCTYIFALQLILLTSLRPTHQISPLLASLSVDRFSIKDKGQSRNILLSTFLQEQVIRYQSIQRQLNNVIPCLKDSQFLLFLIDDFQPTQLSAKKLRLFMNKYWPQHIPYQLRKVFSQTLMELKLPNHLLDRAMGHSRHGEHDGAMTVFPHEEKIIRKVLNQLPDIFKIKLFDD